MGNQCFHAFDSHSKDESGNISAAGTAVLLKFKSSLSLENYPVSMCYANYPMPLCF